MVEAGLVFEGLCGSSTERRAKYGVFEALRARETLVVGGDAEVFCLVERLGCQCRMQVK
jgi:hypothetical protein